MGQKAIKKQHENKKSAAEMKITKMDVCGKTRRERERERERELKEKEIIKLQGQHQLKIS